MTEIKEFLPGNDGYKNAVALQKAIDENSVIEITKPGIYDISDTIYLPSDRTLIFHEGVVIRRQSCAGFNGNAFINKGAFTGIADKNIKIKGLEMLVNDVESTPASEECNKTILGLRGHIAFLYVENLKLENIKITGLCKKDYGIQICNFKNAVIENIYVEGQKDGIHFGPGSDFVLRNGTFKTGDDPIALNADDYSVSNPTLGVIENGLIENCRDIYEDLNDGYFVRILSGSWVDWYSGMKVRHSDSVIYNGRLYRVVMTPSWEELTSINPPDFETGFKTIDGIRWCKAGYEKVYCSKVSNITFRNMHCDKRREAAISFSIEQNEYRRGYYEGSDFPINGDFIFDNIHVNENIKYPVRIVSPVKSVTINNSQFAVGKLHISNDNQAKIKCGPMNLRLENNDFEIEDADIRDREVNMI